MLNDDECNLRERFLFIFFNSCNTEIGFFFETLQPDASWVRCRRSVALKLFNSFWAERVLQAALENSLTAPAPIIFCQQTYTDKNLKKISQWQNANVPYCLVPIYEQRSIHRKCHHKIGHSFFLYFIVILTMLMRHKNDKPCHIQLVRVSVKSMLGNCTCLGGIHLLAYAGKHQAKCDERPQCIFMFTLFDTKVVHTPTWH